VKRSIAYRDIGGRIRAPASKSSMQRATACALLAGGESVLRSPSRSADCLAALSVAAALGAVVEDRGEAFAIRGAPEGALRDARARSLSCGESGLCIRMFSPVAALYSGETELRAEGSLRGRRVDMVIAPLEALGAACSTEGGYPPVRLRGPLRGGRAAVDGSGSSQLLTGLLVALPLASGDSILEVRALASRGYVDLTLNTMRAFGVAAERDSDFRTFRVRGGGRYSPTDFAVEGDWSGAAFLLVAGALASAGGLEVEGLDTASAQPDRAVLEALVAAGASLEIGEKSLTVKRGGLSAFSFDATDCPDLFPPLAALAAACEGVTELRGVGRLRGKESDRAAAITEEFASLGAPVEVSGDVMRIRGAGLARGGRLPGGAVDSRGDHRIAMAAAVASLACEAGVDIVGAECVAKSWPEFFEDLDSAAG
jgi:3-phosphoshikimate 1-carboxyvinyltransferase